MNLPVDDYIDLEMDGLTTQKINEFFETPLERCRYCTNKWMGEECAWKKTDKERVELNAFLSEVSG